MGRGFSSVQFWIDESGRVQKPVVLRATHPEFAFSSIQAVLEWKYDPALKDGKPVVSQWLQTIWFDVVADANRSWGQYSFGLRPKRLGQVPKQFRYDVAPDVLTVVMPVYPFDLLMAGIEGSAAVEFVVQPDYKIDSVKVTSATHPEFGEALTAMVEACVINPAQTKGVPGPAIMTREQKFALGANYLRHTKETKQLLNELRVSDGAIYALGDLDKRPEPLYQPAPAYPPALDRERLSGTAVIEFFIDPTGRVQLPRVVSATRTKFGWAAVTAVQQWFFEPPRKNGNAVFVRMRIPMDFSPRS